MYNKKKLTAILLTVAVATASYAVAFAETDNSTAGSGGGDTDTFITITADAQKDGAFLVAPQQLTVLSDSAENYGFTDSNEGVTMLDVLVKMHKLKYGEDFTAETASSYLAVSSTGWITTIFGESGSSASFFINSEMSMDTADKAIVSDGDTVEYAFFMDTELYSDCYTSFIPNSVNGTAGEPIQLNMYKHEWPMYDTYKLEPISDEYDFEEMTINTVNEDGSISEALTNADGTLIVPDDNGIVTVSFDEPGTYIVTANGFIGEDYPVIAPFCFVTVKPQLTSVTVTMAAQKDGAFLFAPQEISVDPDTAEKYGFIDSDDGVTFLDALAAVHELKYGDAFTPETVGSYLTTSYNAESDYYSIATAFGEPAWATGFYINSSMGYATAEKAILSNGDAVEYCFYQDTTGWSDCYTTFKEKSVQGLAGADIELTILKNSYDENWNSVLLPIDGTDESNSITINTVETDGSISAALTYKGAEAVPDADGKVTLSFSGPGTYIVTAQGIVNGNSAIFAPYCIVTVKPQYTLENISIKASANIKKTEGAEDAKVILAIYNKDGVLIGSETKTADNGEISFDTSIPNGSTVKMFIWDDADGMKPLTTVE